MATAPERLSRAGNCASGGTDGRIARSARTREALVDALLRLLGEGNLRPTAQQIATRARVSLRSVYQHFPAREELLVAASERQRARTLDQTAPVSSAWPLGERLTAFVEQRAQVCELVAPTRRAMLVNEHFSEAIRRSLSGFRADDRAELERFFAPELRTLGRRERITLLAVLAAAGDWTTWESLRRHQGLSVREARAALRRIMAGVLERCVPT